MPEPMSEEKLKERRDAAREKLGSTWVAGELGTLPGRVICCFADYLEAEFAILRGEIAQLKEAPDA